MLTSNWEGKMRTWANHVDNNVESEYYHQDEGDKRRGWN